MLKSLAQALLYMMSAQTSREAWASLMKPCSTVLEKLHWVPGYIMCYHQISAFFIIVLGGRTVFHPSPHRSNFLHDIIVVIDVFVSKARQVIAVDVGVAVANCDSYTVARRSLPLAQQVGFLAQQAPHFGLCQHCRAYQIIVCHNGWANALTQ